MEDNYRRFSRVVDQYRRYRPHYPRQIVDVLAAECGLTAAQSVADIGCGTGLLAELFLANGNRVYGVEPNDDMRAAADELLSAYPGFTSIAGTAEATTLVQHSVDMISVGQAFHWFDHRMARAEFARILKPQGWVMLVWNLPYSGGSAFASAFEQWWQEYIDPHSSFERQRTRPDYITQFFGIDALNEVSIDNDQVYTLESLQGFVLSASRAPQAGDPRYAAMLERLRQIFDQYQQDGTVMLNYDSKMVYGRLD